MHHISAIIRVVIPLEGAMQKLTALNCGRNYKMFYFVFMSSLAVSAPISATPQVAVDQSVQNCRYLQEVEGSSGYGKNYNWSVLAKHSALVRAEKLGASHVVWDRFYPVGAFNGIAVAKAYQCNT